ncbi:Nuclease-related domain protein [Jeotgalicoccus saudimassiliensis]|uniref:Nuclease-related domain protein n=1 Tax=Jeotgalicoccus saudimassiliensis TaxID=1461582 RepID=A0A078M2E4_9STAP|nr:nuclease-related domain-containing protein [Jeotgalicoccus saudimassiliensis]CDZ99527.1 Nuclease-related domain protein [Jeotgalicoccus saudimassiliensis]
MFITIRKKPEELLFLNALGRRTALSVYDADKLNRLEIGMTGEREYDRIFGDAGHNGLYIYRDIYLKIENSVTQYDTLIISESGIVVNEIKNFTGDYRVAGSMWTREGSGPVPDDALSQLRRAVGKLMRLGTAHGMNFDVSGKLVFPNESFRLFSNEENVWKQVVLRVDLRQYFGGFRNEYSGTYASQVADIIERHIVPNPYFKQRVEFDSVRHGLYCGGCGSFKLEKHQFHLRCQTCGSRESNETHLVRAMSDFKYLFGPLEMTSRRMTEFTGGMVNYRTVLRALAKYCYSHGQKKSTSYEFKYYDFEEAMIKERSNRKYKDYIKK